MSHNKQATYSYTDYLSGSSLSTPEDPNGYMGESQFWCGDGKENAFGFSDVHMKALYDDSLITFPDASTDVPIDIVPSTMGYLIDHFNVKNYDSIVDVGQPYSTQYDCYANEILNALVLNNWTPNDESFPTLSCMDMDCQQSESYASQLQAVKMKGTTDSRSDLKGKIATCGSSTTPSKCKPNDCRARSSEAEYSRRFTMYEKLQTLQGLLPESFKGNSRDSIIDGAMGHIKHLQHQLKELSASRLGGESIAAPLVYVKGHHYYPHDLKLEESLEEALGGLIEENHTMARKYLESKGLYIMPIASVNALRGA